MDPVRSGIIDRHTRHSSSSFFSLYEQRATRLFVVDCRLQQTTPFLLVVLLSTLQNDSMHRWAVVLLLLSSLARSLTPRPRQVRRSHAPTRRPKYYWTSIDNLRSEVVDFWKEHGIESSEIPNEALLQYYGRHDLRGAIAWHGGRWALGDDFPVMSGTWKEATIESEALQQLVARDPSLSVGVPPRSRSHGWKHSPTRRPPGYWTTTRILEHLYNYTEDVEDRPSVWMPRPSELRQNGHTDLFQAMQRSEVRDWSKAAGMVPYAEWRYFEGQLELIVRLQQYLGDNQEFPIVSKLKREGYDELYALIQDYGGRKFVEARLMGGWGPFDLDFARRLLLWIREDHMRRRPPLSQRTLAMPLERKLARTTEGQWLASQMDRYGGYESIARRLGLAILWDERKE